MYWPMNPRKPRPDVVYCDKNYFAGIRGEGGRWLMRPGNWHTGVDWNGPNGGDTDLGQPVHAVEDGLVVFSGWGRGGAWGNIVVVWHPELKVWTRYAHLALRTVREGQQVKAGEQIGTVGKGASNQFAAHLHFDVMVKKPIGSDGRADWSDWPGGNLARVQEYYADPAEFFAGQRVLEPPRWAGRRT